MRRFAVSVAWTRLKENIETGAAYLSEERCCGCVRLTLLTPASSIVREIKAIDQNVVILFNPDVQSR